MNNVGISLGKDCLPAGWAIDHGYRKKLNDGYKTCPFDRMVSNYDGIVKCIIEDFLNFTNPSYLIFDGNVVRNTYYNFGFNHETPDHANLYIKEQWPGGTNHYIDNNFANFIIRYDNRINNFRTYLSDQTNLITFILYLSGNKEVEDDCKDLRDALAITYPKLIYRIIIIDGPFPHNVSKTRIIKIIDNTTLTGKEEV